MNRPAKNPERERLMRELREAEAEAKKVPKKVTKDAKDAYKRKGSKK